MAKGPRVTVRIAPRRPPQKPRAVGSHQERAARKALSFRCVRGVRRRDRGFHCRGLSEATEFADRSRPPSAAGAQHPVALSLPPTSICNSSPTTAEPRISGYLRLAILAQRFGRDLIRADRVASRYQGYGSL
jgi:hypothetical protein